MKKLILVDVPDGFVVKKVILEDIVIEIICHTTNFTEIPIPTEEELKYEAIDETLGEIDQKIYRIAQIKTLKRLGL